jgi:tetratricopeptide (TPR) repeat protein
VMLSRVGGDLLADIPQMSQVRRKLLQDALKFYQEAFKDEDQRPTVRLRTARSHHMVALIHGHLGKRDLAREHHRLALEILAELEREQQEVPLARRAIARSHTALAELEWDDSRLDEALVSGQRAVELYELLALDRPGDPELQMEQATARGMLARVQFSRGQYRESEKMLRALRPALVDLTRRFPENEEYRYRLAAAQHNLADTYDRLDRLNDALVSFQGRMRYRRV